jgi:hypothetical protein
MRDSHLQTELSLYNRGPAQCEQPFPTIIDLSAIETQLNRDVPLVGDKMVPWFKAADIYWLIDPSPTQVTRLRPRVLYTPTLLYHCKWNTRETVQKCMASWLHDKGTRMVPDMRQETAVEDKALTYQAMGTNMLPSFFLHLPTFTKEHTSEHVKSKLSQLEEDIAARCQSWIIPSNGKRVLVLKGTCSYGKLSVHYCVLNNEGTHFLRREYVMSDRNVEMMSSCMAALLSLTLGNHQTKVMVQPYVQGVFKHECRLFATLERNSHLPSRDRPRADSMAVQESKEEEATGSYCWRYSYGVRTAWLSEHRESDRGQDICSQSVDSNNEKDQACLQLLHDILGTPSVYLDFLHRSLGLKALRFDMFCFYNERDELVPVLSEMAYVPDAYVFQQVSSTDILYATAKNLSEEMLPWLLNHRETEDAADARERLTGGPSKAAREAATPASGSSTPISRSRGGRPITPSPGSKAVSTRVRSRHTAASAAQPAEEEEELEEEEDEEESVANELEIVASFTTLCRCCT